MALLSPTGRLGFITPHKFMTIQAGRALRSLLTAGNLLEEVVHFGVKQVFGRAASNYTCIIILDRSSSANVQVEQVGSLEGWRYGEAGVVTTLAAATLGVDAWQFANTETRAVFNRVRAACPTQLSAVAEIFVALQTSADAVYIFHSAAETVDHHILHWDGRDWPIEKGVLRPFLHDVQFTAFSRPVANAWLIFPYEFVTVRGRTAARLLQPGEMAERYPNCLAYLTARRVQLEARAISGGKADERQFYQFGRSQSLVKFNGPKIILPALSLEPRYAYDDTNVMVTGGGNGPYYLIRQRDGRGVTDYYLLAVLNHPVSEAFVRTATSMFGGGYYSHGKQFIEDLPVPLPSDADRATIEALVVRLIAAQGAIATARTPHDKTLYERQAADLRQQVEAHVTQLFGLTPADMEIVRAVPVPS